MNENYRIARLNIDSIKKYGALDLVWKIFEEFEAPDYPDEGIEEFRKFLDFETIKQKISRNEMFFWGCFSGDAIVGVIAARQPCHISLLFVNKEHHRRGIGRELFHTVTSFYAAAGIHQEITVHSSPYAVEVYHKLGFVDTDTEQLLNGIRFTPMKYILR
ncbi:GNAT family N-acetyltransferase [Lacrimispora saccharolytica]|uniref:GCN5-related N-acetyltransferase n=1 Tax=Lacrimispora saccharolytica (strain ATCC 35040 / DSM 2544 / NRCC 2533 / WM1) TaxID=610130 RepID=D9R2X6_LACSW|nr:GNAT family N-acetyltransferase [Lacrimispora saccharolytica]ADL02966.1 GCN5-related N-acetyltransferase [[Clostridium] saccharolyticum WM1]QRV18842.1 GNAT family N-acetyltransferase [Lacrimispora saccharolytica]